MMRVALWGFWLFQIFISYVTAPFFFLLYGRKKQPLPPLESYILKTSAVELAHMIRNKQVTSEEVVRAFVDRVRAVSKSLNAVVAQRFDSAIHEAKKLDALIAEDNLPEELSEENAPFLGVPFTAKEAFAMTGLPNTSGLVPRNGLSASKDAVAVQRMRKAGAIPIGLTNCSELCMWYESNNLLYGRTNNAYHQGRMVGGSSGGEGCNVTSCGAPIGIGSDIGGSIRLPAFFNGVFGHKGTTGVVSNEGQFPIPNTAEEMRFLSTGPICRCACDLLPMYKVLAGPEGCAKMKLDTKVDLKKIKIYYMEDDGGSFFTYPVEKEIKETVRRAANHFFGIVGCEVSKRSFNKLKLAMPIWATGMNTTGGDSFCFLMGNSEKEVNPWWELLKWCTWVGRRHTLPAIGLGLVESFHGSAKEEERINNMGKELLEEFNDVLGDNAVFLYPTQPCSAPYHNQPLMTVPNFAYTAIFNTLGLPVTAVPMGLDHKGMPIGIQVVGALYQDHLTLAVAQELEKVFGGWVPPPSSG